MDFCHQLHNATRTANYPGWSGSFQFQSVFDPYGNLNTPSGFYFATHDPQGSTKQFIVSTTTVSGSKVLSVSPPFFHTHRSTFTSNLSLSRVQYGSFWVQANPPDTGIPTSGVVSTNVIPPLPNNMVPSHFSF